MGTDPQVLALLASIDASLKVLVARVRAKEQSDEKICDGPKGDPVIKAKDPRDWPGEPMTGRHFSECPAEYLDMLAERYDYFASKEEDQTKQKYNLLDARRARAWAVRIRNGYVAPPPTTTEGEPRW